MSEGIIYSKLAEVIRDTEPVGKNGYNGQQNFAFRSIDDTVHSVRKALIKHGVAIVPEVVSVEKSTYSTKSGAMMNVADVLVAYSLIAEDGSCVIATMAGQAADSGDKAISKALSMAFKYFCFQTFLCGTDGDPDAEIVPDAAPVLTVANAKRQLLEALGGDKNAAQAAWNGRKDITVYELEELIEETLRKENA
jgi:hypothetical protein